MEKIVWDGLVFSVYDCIPRNYEIWNVGKNMIDGYLPICTLSARQPFPGAREVDTESLRVIKTDGAQIILAAANGGCTTLAKMERFIKRNINAKEGSWEAAQVRRIKKALPYMRQIKWC